jgi:hypothetical protein
VANASLQWSARFANLGRCCACSTSSCARHDPFGQLCHCASPVRALFLPAPALLQIFITATHECLMPHVTYGLYNMYNCQLRIPHATARGARDDAWRRGEPTGGRPRTPVDGNFLAGAGLAARRFAGCSLPCFPFRRLLLLKFEVGTGIPWPPPPGILWGGGTGPKTVFFLEHKECASRAPG